MPYVCTSCGRRFSISRIDRHLCWRRTRIVVTIAALALAAIGVVTAFA